MASERDQSPEMEDIWVPASSPLASSPPASPSSPSARLLPFAPVSPIAVQAVEPASATASFDNPAAAVVTNPASSPTPAIPPIQTPNDWAHLYWQGKHFFIALTTGQPIPTVFVPVPLAFVQWVTINQPAMTPSSTASDWAHFWWQVNQVFDAISIGHSIPAALPPVPLALVQWFTANLPAAMSGLQGPPGPQGL